MRAWWRFSGGRRAAAALPKTRSRALSLAALRPAPSHPAPQDERYGGDPKWVSNDVVDEYDGRIYVNLPPACTLMLVQQ